MWTRHTCRRLGLSARAVEEGSRVYIWRKTMSVKVPRHSCAFSPTNSPIPPLRLWENVHAKPLNTLRVLMFCCYDKPTYSINPDRAGMTSKSVAFATFCSKEPGSFIGQEIWEDGMQEGKWCSIWHWSSTTKGSVPHSSRRLSKIPDDVRSLKCVVSWIIMHHVMKDSDSDKLILLQVCGCVA